MNTLLWVVVPYLSIASFTGGMVWRYRYGRAGWTTRSSQLYEGTLLRWASPLFHYGILAVLAGHAGGLLVPESWTRAAGVGDHTYHLIAVSAGTVTGLAAVLGLGTLLVRRCLVRPVYLTTTHTDMVMYPVLAGLMLLGMETTLTGGRDYRQTVAPWFRSLWYLHPDPNLITPASMVLRLHVLAACVLFAMWPYTRLVHALSAPIGYLTRPPIVYRAAASQRSRRRATPIGPVGR